jgi:hypothetical protein
MRAVRSFDGEDKHKAPASLLVSLLCASYLRFDGEDKHKAPASPHQGIDIMRAVRSFDGEDKHKAPASPHPAPCPYREVGKFQQEGER